MCDLTNFPYQLNKNTKKSKLHIQIEILQIPNLVLQINYSKVITQKLYTLTKTNRA